MIDFFIKLHELEDLEFTRSIWPEDEVTGDPWLVVFSDGSQLGIGAMVYIRWELAAGGWWSTFVLSKCKIGPKSRISIPRMELNGAVINKRLKEFVDLTLKRKFERVIHLVDSSTVLGYLHKEDARLKPYERVWVAV